MSMHRWLVVILLVGCGTSDGGDGGPRPPSEDEHGGCGGGPACPSDQVCLRGGGGCVPPDQSWSVHLRWTVRGQPATAAACAPSPDLRVAFSGRDPGSIGFAPVPCKAGLFTIDRVARDIVNAELQPTVGGATAHAMIDPVTGEGTADLSF